MQPAPAQNLRVAILRNRLPHRRETWIRGAARQNADDRRRHAVDRDRASHDLWISAEAMLPQRVPDHDRRRRSRTMIVLCEHSTNHRSRAEHREEFWSDERGTDVLRCAAARDDDAVAANERYALESLANTGILLP